MTETEKMEVLKMACAEMILNTAKEAAARVMASDLKSRRLEQDLISSKEEVARMLLRLKQMIDTKTKESEVTLLNKQNKVDELESQLNEAEGIILDLRAELNQVQEHLEEAQSKNLDHSRQSGNSKMYYVNPNGKASDYEKLNIYLDSGLGLNIVDASNCNLDKRISKLSSGCHVYSIDYHQNLDSVKEPDLLRNSCTQTISATETTLVENAQIGKNECVRRSIRKRKLKHWDEVIGACSHPLKKVRQAISSISCCKNNKLKQNIESHEAKYPDRERGNSEIVKPDEHDTILGLNSSPKIGCDAKCSPAIEASNNCHDKGKRVFKYTFSRKRRKGSIIYPDRKLSSGENSLRKSLRGKQNGSSGLLSSRFLSMDSQRLVQVAHQLISLSGRGDSN